MMRRYPGRPAAVLPTAILMLAALFAALPPSTASDWTRFRGANAAGIADNVPAPLEMQPNAGLVWRRPAPPGKSSPVLAGKRLFLTAYEGGRLLTIALDRRTGETLWTRELRRSHVDKRNRLNDPAVPTPVTDGETVYVFFADFGLAAYTADGRERWRRPLGPFTSPHGIASSPPAGRQRARLAARTTGRRGGHRDRRCKRRAEMERSAADVFGRLVCDARRLPNALRRVAGGGDLSL